MLASHSAIASCSYFLRLPSWSQMSMMRVRISSKRLIAGALVLLSLNGTSAFRVSSAMTFCYASLVSTSVYSVMERSKSPLRR